MAQAQDGQGALFVARTPAATDVTQEERETRDVVLGFVEHRYTLDQVEDDSRQDVATSIASVFRTDSSSPWQGVGRRLACMGDEVDAVYGPELKHLATAPIPSGQTLYEYFVDVSRRLFSDNVFNLGRIAILLQFGYHLGMEHVIKQGHPNVLSDMIGYIVRFILTEKVINASKSIASWILDRGGWVSAVNQGIKDLGANWASVCFVLGLCMTTISAVVLLKK